MGSNLQMLMVGDSFVGKSSYMLRLSENTFTNSYISTIGVDFKIIQIKLDGQPIKLQVFETTGGERFRTVTTSYYRFVHGFFLIYNVTSDNSFKNIPRWMDEIGKIELSYFC
jgi:Ras-related protein Rab-1A